MSTTLQWSNVEVENSWYVTGQKLMPITAALCHAVIAMDIFQRKAYGNTCAHLLGMIHGMRQDGRGKLASKDALKLGF